MRLLQYSKTCAMRLIGSSGPCFVCLQNDGLRMRACACNSAVHAKCLLRMVETVPSHQDGKCPMCLTRYPLRPCTSTNCTVDRESVAIVCAALMLGGSCACVPLVIILAWTDMHRNLWLAHVLMLASAALAASGFLLALVLAAFRRRAFLCFKFERNPSWKLDPFQPRRVVQRV